jgi:hypothetical protein
VVAVWCVYAGGIVAIAGLIAVIKPLRSIRISSRRRGALVALAGAGLAALGLALPARARQVTTPATRLDAFVPVYQFDEVHSIHVDAPPERVFAALKAVTAADILLFRTLTWIRRFGRRGPESILNAPERLPILEVATRSGFVLLAEIPSREILVGAVVLAPPGGRFERTAAGFAALNEPGFAKAGMNFLLEPEGGGTRLTTATRVVATDAAATRAFAKYWRVIYPGSALIRRMWLRAAKQRAERLTATEERATRK